MAKFQNDDMLDAALNYLKDNTTQLTLCEGEPATYEEANSPKGTGAGKALARLTVSPTDFTGPADADDANGGRQLQVNQQLAVPVEQTGNGDHWVLTSTADQTLRYGTTGAVQTVSQGSTVDVSEFKIRVRDAQ